MKLTKETLKQLIKEELEDVMEEQIMNEDMAYFNQSMQDRVELQYGGKRVDFKYRTAAPKYRPELVKKAVVSLAGRGKLGDIEGLANVIFDVLNRTMDSDQPTLQQLKNMRVYFN